MLKKTKMRIVNTTDIPDSLVREIIRFVTPYGLHGFDVMVKNCQPNHHHYLGGHAYYVGSSYHARAVPFVVLRTKAQRIETLKYARVVAGSMAGFNYVDKPVYPVIHKTYQYGQLKGRRYWLADRIECLVYLAAHEIRHLWQAKTKNKRSYAFGSKGRFSEIDTESYAINRLRAWRKLSLTL